MTLPEFPQLPYVAPPSLTPTALCDSCYEEVPATRSMNYTAFVDTPDEHGGSLDICDRGDCETKARYFVEEVVDGVVVEIEPLAQPTAAVVAA